MQEQDQGITSAQVNRHEQQAAKAQPKAKGKSRGRAAATPYKHGKGYSMRRSYRGHALWVSGCETAAAAVREMNRKVREVDLNAKPWGLGPERTSVAQALQDYALERLPFLKGAPQEARRINNYLRAAGLRLLEVKAIDPQDIVDDPKTGEGARYEVNLIEHCAERKIPNGLGAHRKALLTASARTEQHRAVLASTAMSEVTRKMMQDYVIAMRRDRHAAATIALERSVLRVLFNHAFTVWNWAELHDNPATKLKMPKVINDRDIVLSVKQQQLLDEALQDCRNKLAGPTFDLLRETAMRVSEPLQRAKWKDVDWERKVLTVVDGKNGSREVPLSPGALEALQRLQEMGSSEPHEPIVRVTYEALKAAWRRACERAGITDVHIHDLRHTAATRMALKSGNVFLVKALTGHKTMQMLSRYVNVKAGDVVEFMHNGAQPTPGKAQRACTPQEQAPASTAEVPPPADTRALVDDEATGAAPTQPTEVRSSAVVYQFPTRRAA